MLTRKLWAVLLALSLFVIAGCTGSTGKPAEPPKTEPAPAKVEKKTTYPVTVKDDLGRDVTLPAEPKRVISVAPSNTELVFALGKGSLLVGRSDFCDYPAEAKAIESIGNFFPPNYEKIVGMKPDLILMIGGADDAPRKKLADELKIPVIVLQPQNFNQLYAGFKTLGVALNAQEAAEKLVATMQADIKAITDKTAKATTKPKVFYEVWNDPLMTAGSGTFIDALITMAGGVNVGAEVKEFSVFPLEKLAAATPDYIIVSDKAVADSVKTRKGWEAFRAVKENKVVPLADQNHVVRPGPRLVLGLKWFAQTLQPELLK